MSDASRAWSWRHAIIQSETLPSTTRLVLLTISCHMNDLGEGAYPSQETLAKETGLTDRAVRTHIEIAIAQGWLTRDEHGFRGQKWRRHEYRAAWPDPLDVDQGAEARSAPSAERCGTSFQKVRNQVPTNIPKNINTPYPTNDRAEAGAQDVEPEPADLLAEIWPAWPESGRGNEDASRAAIGAMTDADRAMLARAWPAWCKAVCRRQFAMTGYRVPNLTSALRARDFAEFDGDPPPLAEDGRFLITPDRPEWRKWLAWIARTYGALAEADTREGGRFLPVTRHPPKP